MNFDPALIKNLAQDIAPGTQEAQLEGLTGSVTLARAVVTAVTTSGATITLRGGSVPNVPCYRDISVAVGDVVDVLLVGPNPRIIGVISTSYTPAVPHASRAVTAYSNNWITSPSNTHQRVPIAHSQGNPALWDNATSIFTVPETGYWLMTARIRWNDDVTANNNVGFSITDSDVMHEARSNWAVSSSGPPRLAQSYVTMEYLSTGQQWRVVSYASGAANYSHRHFSAIMLARA